MNDAIKTARLEAAKLYLASNVAWRMSDEGIAYWRREVMGYDV